MIQDPLSFARMVADLGFGRKCLTLEPSIHFSCPLDVREGRQSLGFDWGAKCRSTTIPMRHRPHLRIMRDQVRLGRAKAAGIAV